MSDKRDLLMAHALSKVRSPTLLNSRHGDFEFLGGDLPPELIDQLSVIRQTQGIKAAKNFIMRLTWARNDFEVNFSKK